MPGSVKLYPLFRPPPASVATSTATSLRTAPNNSSRSVSLTATAATATLAAAPAARTAPPISNDDDDKDENNDTDAWDSADDDVPLVFFAANSSRWKQKGPKQKDKKKKKKRERAMDSDDTTTKSDYHHRYPAPSNNAKSIDRPAAKRTKEEEGQSENEEAATILPETQEMAEHSTHDEIKQRPNRRIYSESAMDYTPDLSQSQRQPHHPLKGTGLLARIVQRTTRGYPLTVNTIHHHHGHKTTTPSCRPIAAKHTHHSMWPTKWRSPPWLSLEAAPSHSIRGSGSSGTNNSNTSVSHMAWDTLGVLLAVVRGKTLEVYDWDMVRAADMQARNDRARTSGLCDHNSAEWKMTPIVMFVLPHPASCLIWNPFDDHELAVGFRVSGDVRIYNLNRVDQWRAKIERSTSSSSLSSLTTKTPPSKTYRNIAVSRTNGSATAVLFLNVDHVLVSLADRVYCWKLTPSGRTPILGWRFHLPSSTVTSMAPLGSNLVVLGTNIGQLCVLDWRRTKKERSFSMSNERRPIVIQMWTPHTRLSAVQKDSRLRMGIVRLVVEATPTTIVADANSTIGEKIDHDTILSGEGQWGRCRLTWVTQSGWLLSTIMESPSLRGPCVVHETSPRVVYRNADGETIDTSHRSVTWSLPQESIGVDVSNNAMISWVAVPEVTHVLSHHDKFVLDSQPSSIRSTKRAVLVRSPNGEVHNIPLPPMVKGVPQALAVHPDKEWIVLGEGRKLHILVGRECKRRLREDVTG